MVVDTLESAAGVFLLFVAPGYAWTRALFPEWKFRGPRRWENGVRTVTLTLVWSVAIDVVAGSVLTEVPSLGFSAAWSDPRLEWILLATTIGGLVTAMGRGAFRLRGESTAPAPPGESPPLGWMREADRLVRDQARLRRKIRKSPVESPERTRFERELIEVSEQLTEVHRRREAELAR